MRQPAKARLRRKGQSAMHLLRMLRRCSGISVLIRQRRDCCEKTTICIGHMVKWLIDLLTRYCDGYKSAGGWMKMMRGGCGELCAKLCWWRETHGRVLIGRRCVMTGGGGWRRDCRGGHPTVSRGRSNLGSSLGFGIPPRRERLPNLHRMSLGLLLKMLMMLQIVRVRMCSYGWRINRSLLLNDWKRLLTWNTNMK